MMKFARLPLVAAVLVVAGSGCSLSQTQPAPPPRGGGDVNTSTLQTTGANTLTGEVWVDNWFSLWVNGRKLIEDSVPITTERSFNAERFSFKADAPYTFAFQFRDFMQDETGLEYIGTGRQQMGDGGAIAQFTDATSGKVIATTDGSWRCLVVQHAPVGGQACAQSPNPQPGQGDCAAQTTAIPDGWTKPGFDDSGWAAASVHGAGEVGPKGGYDAISWSPAAEFIWGGDLKRDNIVLCRATIGG
jgi:hypothetical protein